MTTKNGTALLVMDVQGGIVKNLGEKAAQFIEQVTKSVEAALVVDKTTPLVAIPQSTK